VNLATRLDRLRGLAHDPPPDALAARLDRLRRHSRERSPVAHSIAALARAIGAEQLADGLLVRDTGYELAPGAAELTKLPEVCDLDSPDWVYLDTETTGLSGGVGNLAFLVGVARYRSIRCLEVRQYLLAGFSGEQHMLSDLLSWMGQGAVLVSYNGKCFDLPLLDGRCRLHQIACELGALRHLDLVHSVRRAFQRHWPDCRLQTAEKLLLGLYRVGDLPGAEAPAAWQSWLRAGRAARLAQVVQHNHQDVVSLALLHRRLPHDYAGDARAGLDHAAIGTAWGAIGRSDTACRVWERAGGFLDDRGRLLLAAHYRRQGRWSRAEAVWMELHARGDAKAACELSKYYEHHRHDYRRALDFAFCCTPRERATRVARLRAKIERDLQLPLLRRMPAVTR
jgi:uncharacterized protein YprB with RNaseH-like and TPR domain